MESILLNHTQPLEAQGPVREEEGKNWQSQMSELREAQALYPERGVQENSCPNVSNSIPNMGPRGWG